MRRLALIVLALPIACSEVSKLEPGPTTSFYRPTGIGVYGGNLVVASSNFDLRYDDDEGGSVISVDPLLDPAPWRGGLNIRSFAGELAIVDPAQCGLADPLALVPVRASDVLYRIRLGAAGALSCDAGCELSLADRSLTDPFAVGVACDGSGFARAYVGHLRSATGRASVTQVDLTKQDSEDGFLLRASFESSGQIRGFAFDPLRKRLYAAQTASGFQTVIRYVDLAGGCRFGALPTENGCRVGAAALWPGLEPHGIALSRAELPDPYQRLYVAARVYDPVAAASVGIRVGDVGTVLLVADLVDDLTGDTELRVVKTVEALGQGAGALVLLPGRAPARREVVALLAGDSGELVLFDDETGDLVVVGIDPSTGHPLVGDSPFGLAVDPVLSAGMAHLYVGSFQESFVTQIDVPVDDINGLTVPPPAPGFRRIAGGTQ